MRVIDPTVSPPPSPPTSTPEPTARPAEPARPAHESPWSQLADKFEGAVSKAKSVVGLAHELWDDHVATSLHVQNNPALPVPADRGGLRIASFNIERGGQQLDRVEAELRALAPEVACLQECSPQSAQKLASELGMHVAWFSSGQAILSKYPITDAENLTLPGALDDRLRASWEHQSAEPLETRSVLRATLRVGGRAIDVLDTHLALGDEASNARQLERLATLVAEREQLGHAVVLAGDFNDNFSLARQGAADPKGVVATPTDTAQEFKDRYGSSVEGNIADARVASAARNLLEKMNYYWDAPDRRVVLDGKVLSLDEVRAELTRAAPGSPRQKELLKALDGTSHLTANKRFDNIFASKSLRIAASTIDQTARASDHQAVLAEVRWD
jgi:endonuclease/exonuclease/phosphatase family metal-dependent hydrolase